MSKNNANKAACNRSLFALKRGLIMDLQEKLSKLQEIVYNSKNIVFFGWRRGKHGIGAERFSLTGRIVQRAYKSAGGNIEAMTSSFGIRKNFTGFTGIKCFLRRI